MSRREALGLLLVAGLILLGRVLRRALLLGPDGGWREPGWLAAHLPPPPPDPVPSSSRPALPESPLDPNTCPADSLELLPGIGPAIAGRIVEARAGGVHFACARDLQVVRGIGPAKAGKIAPYLRFATEDTVEIDGMRSAR